VAPDLTGLRPIGEASFGPLPQQEAVLGQDDRIQITNTADYPWRVHASLLVTARDGSRWIGTGWFIGPHTLVTAGHVVYIKNSGVPGRDGWAQSVQVMPGRNGTTLPYGSVLTSNLRTVNGWADRGDPEFDYGAIILPSDLGSTTGWFGFGAYTDATLLASSVNISGYPGDKPAGTQWYHWNKVDSVGPRKVFYAVDTFGGQSGSAVYRIDNGERYGVAVHAYGGTASNSGTRITRAVFDNLVAWKA
jgi:V8-like Glu-specific endopeptidase